MYPIDRSMFCSKLNKVDGISSFKYFVWGLILIGGGANADNDGDDDNNDDEIGE